MAAQQFTLVYSPNIGKEVKKDVVISTPLAEPLPDEIYVGFGTTVATRRGTEIANAMKWLIAGIRDRKLLDATAFQGAALVTAVNIDVITLANRRTSSSLVTSTVADPDIVVAMGGNVTAAGYKVMHETHFEQLIRAVQEWLYKNG